MPLYEFECEDGHRSEALFSINECPAYIVCPQTTYRETWDDDFTTKFKTWARCGNRAEKSWSTPANINLGAPTIIFRDANNPMEVQVATHSQQQTPEGFVREELRNPIERSKFEKEQQKITDVKNEMITESVQLRDNETRKNRHSKINRNMSKYDTGTQELLRFAMQRTRKKKDRVKKTNVRLDINHLDRSNLTPS